MHPITRRDLIRSAAAGAAALALRPLAAFAADEKKAGFTLPKLPYAYDALEPFIDAETMQIHHSKHHQAYVDNLNKALAGTDWAEKPIDEILRNIAMVPEEKRQAVINNGGGHYNHSMFWEIMAKDGGKPAGELAKAIETFGGLDKLKKDVNAAGAARFGSGWAWVVIDGGKLKVLSSANQDCPLMNGQVPVLGVDVWEHAYYLKYRNLRAKYLDAWWNVVDWEAVGKRFEKAAK